MEIKGNMSSDRIMELQASPKDSNIPVIASSLVMNIAEMAKADNYNGIEKAMDEFRECGFSGFIALFDSGYEEYIPGVLSRAADRGLFMIISSNVLRGPLATNLNKWKKEADLQTCTIDKINSYINGFNEQINQFLDCCMVGNKFSPAFGGVYLKDEPEPSALKERCPDLSDLTLTNVDSKSGLYYCLSNVYKILMEKLPAESVICVNLFGEHYKMFGNYDEDKSSYWENYLSYLNSFATIDSTIPYLWSYDLYPIIQNNYLLDKNRQYTIGSPPPKLSENGDVSIKYEKFYTDLEMFSEQTSGKGSIFWAYHQSMEFMSANEYHPIAREEFLRYTMFSSFAMGCQGVMYWTYHQRKYDGSELYLSAPLNIDSDKTAVWYFAKNVNAEIRRYNSVFRGCALVSFGHVGKIYDQANMASFPFGRIDHLIVYGKGILITRINNGSYEYIVIVSHDVCNYQLLSMYFNKVTPVYLMTLSSDILISPSPQNSQPNQTGFNINKTLAPGGYLIFRYTK